jgi:hypothetical protein
VLSLQVPWLGYWSEERPLPALNYSMSAFVCHVTGPLNDRERENSVESTQKIPGRIQSTSHSFREDRNKWREDHPDIKLDLSSDPSCDCTSRNNS